MPEIKQLDPHVADLIAAGEVVERPASVVKELMENAIDAGAAHVTVEIANGGMTMIRVTDDGCGIPPEQAATAFLRHATSKISTEWDLERIGTLGFRGEALAAISAVSRVELFTRTADAPLGISLALEGGTVLSEEEAGCPVGTTMVVRDLFFNTPARLKFMKRDQAEGAAVFAVVQRVALSHPEVSVKFIREGRQELLTPGDGKTESAMYAVFGRDIALGFVPVRSAGEEIEVTGYTSMPACCRGSRSYQHFFVNGRYVKSRTMQAAVEEAYKNQKMVGKFPGCVIHLTCKLGSVDVNVHPTKTEVKFTSENQVFSAVYHAVLDALERDRSRPAALAGKPKAHDTVTPNQTVLSAVKAAATVGKEGAVFSFTTPVMKPAPAPMQSRPAPAASAPKPETPVKREIVQIRTPVVEPKIVSAEPPRAQGAFKPAVRAVSITPPGEEFDPEGVEEKVAAPAPAKEEQPPVPVAQTPDPVTEVPVPEERPEEEPWVIRGELFRTYIVVEQGEKALLIDKHAAHERMNFDRLRAQGYKPMLQQLLMPLTFRPAPEERDILLSHVSLLEEFGFAVEEFGADSLIVRQAPDDVAEEEIESTLLELARRLLTTGTADPTGARDELLHTMACKAAIKGGWKSGAEELERVAAAVMRGEVKYCPHGRPVAIELTKKQLEKQFKRA